MRILYLESKQENSSEKTPLSLQTFPSLTSYLPPLSISYHLMSLSMRDVEEKLHDILTAMLTFPKICSGILPAFFRT